MMQQPAQMPSDQQAQQYHQQQQQQWMMMPPQQQPVPPPAGWAPPTVPPPQMAQAQQYPTQQNPGSEEIRSLWIGDLLPWMEESYLLTCFSQTGEVNANTCLCTCMVLI